MKIRQMLISCTIVLVLFLVVGLTLATANSPPTGAVQANYAAISSQIATTSTITMANTATLGQNGIQAVVNASNSDEATIQINTTATAPQRAHLGLSVAINSMARTSVSTANSANLVTGAFVRTNLRL